MLLILISIAVIGLTAFNGWLYHRVAAVEYKLKMTARVVGQDDNTLRGVRASLAELGPPKDINPK